MCHYADIELVDIVQKAGIAVKGFDTVYFTYDKNSQEAKMKIEGNEYDFPLLALSKKALEKVLNDFKIGELNSELVNKISLNMKYIPNFLIPFSFESSFPEKKIIKFVILGFNELLLQGREKTIGIDAFLRNYVIPYNLFDCYDGEERRNIIERCHSVNRKIIKNYYAEYLEVRKKSNVDVRPYTYDVIKNPYREIDSKDITKERKKILKIADGILKDIGEKDNIPYQTDIYDFLLPDSKIEDIEVG
jgi:hypothetical protein